MSKQLENSHVEFKRDLTCTYLKTVSAFANYGGGEIIFGVDNKGSAVGLENVQKTRLAIENQVNDNLQPVPEFSLVADEMTRTVTLTVFEGRNKPYVYKKKAYKRSDTSTVVLEREEYNRLVLIGQNREFEDLMTEQQNLSFHYLETRLIEQIGIDKLARDILKTLGLFVDKEHYNHAAALVSDQNGFPGVDVAQFGATIDVFLDRQQFEGHSLIKIFDDVIAFIAKTYSFEQIIDHQRVKVELIPMKAIREAVANALVHREWDTKASVRVAMHEDRVTITSPGGLPFGVSRAEYLHGQVSVLRNPRLAHVFERLGIVDKFGTGILRILEAYRHSVVKPAFDVFPNSLTVSLPVMNTIQQLSADEQSVLYIIQHLDDEVSRAMIEADTGYSKAKVIRVLNALIEKNVVEKVGAGPATYYRALD